jgi:hypothetical protein
MMIRAVVISACFALLGCSDLNNCAEDDGEVINANHQEAISDKSTGVFYSCPWEGPRSPFPPKVTLVFTHDLGATPEVVSTYVSFQSEGSDLTENAGNQGRIRCVDDEEIWIKNDTCEESFFVRVVAQASGATNMTRRCCEQLNEPCSEP